MNKRGDEKILSIWMFIIWALIFLAVIIATSFFYGGEFDSREIHSKILLDRVASCFIEGNTFLEIKDIYSECNLNREVFDEEDFYFNLSYSGNSIFAGNKDFETQCALNDDKKSKGFAQCSREKFYLKKGEDKLVVEIFTGNNYLGGSN